MVYSQVKKIISVNIVYFDLGQGDDYIYHGTTNFIGVNKKDILKLSEDQKLLYKTDSIKLESRMAKLKAKWKAS